MFFINSTISSIKKTATTMKSDLLAMISVLTDANSPPPLPPSLPQEEHDARDTDPDTDTDCFGRQRRREHPRQRSHHLHHAQPGVSKPRARCDGRKDERWSLGHGERRGRLLSSNGAAAGT